MRNSYLKSTCQGLSFKSGNNNGIQFFISFIELF